MLAEVREAVSSLICWVSGGLVRAVEAILRFVGS